MSSVDAEALADWLNSDERHFGLEDLRAEAEEHELRPVQGGCGDGEPAPKYAGPYVYDEEPF